MPISHSKPQLLADTSVAVALVVADHDHHGATMEAVGDRSIGLAGHAVFETYSVLTRLPAPLRRTPSAVERLMTTSFAAPCFLSAEGAARLMAELTGRGITGGAVYDALVGAAAAEHGIVLMTRDRRAVDVYRALEVDYQLVR
jgi:predicted nucleic acid-binding protein